jgi:hypothetical protein
MGELGRSCKPFNNSHSKLSYQKHLTKAALQYGRVILKSRYSQQDSRLAFFSATVKMLTGCRNDPLIAALQESENQHDPSFWSFTRPTPRKGAHALLHYPAMMVPSLQGLIMKCVQSSQQDVTMVLDPYVGSGTVLVEAMGHGLNFQGVDINPLAGLACLAKAGPYYVEAFQDKSIDLLIAISTDSKTHTPREFAGRDKWHAIEVSQSLEKICHHISNEPTKWARRLFWLALCRVVRATCRSRKSTYKLHIEITKVNQELPDVCRQFIQVIEQFQSHLDHEYESLSAKNLLVKGRYKGALNTKIGDSQSVLTGSSFAKNSYDLVMTSPPYGDNVTTIPYGQFSYLPLQWIDVADIDETVDAKLIANTHSTDTASLGGTLRGANEKADSLGDRYTSAAGFLGELQNEVNGKKRFASFFYDLDKSIDGIVETTKHGAVHAWTIANRRICGLEAPMVPMMKEMLEVRGMRTVGTISRGIHFKKMASRNALTTTMTTETILLARKD